MNGPDQSARFEQIVMPHLDAAYNLARWLMHKDHAAEDAVQEAYLRAYEAFGQFRGVEARAWLLTIVRNTCFTQLQRDRRHGHAVSLEEDFPEPASDVDDPAMLLMRRITVENVREAIEQLPINLREVIVLREIEGLAYQQIAAVIGVPIGTVMSRLSRARGRLQQIMTPNEGAAREL